MKKFIALLVVAVIASVGVIIWRSNPFGEAPVNNVSLEEADVTASKIADIMGIGLNSATQNRYSGVVETQQTLDITLDQTKTVEEILVKEGDLVEVGTPLFTYNTDEMEKSLVQAQLDLERAQSQIESLNHQIETLTAEKAKAKQDQQLDYTIQIQSVEASLKETEYSIKAKQTEMERTQASIDNATVYSELAGRVQKINETTTYDNYGNTLPFMTIITEGDLRIKGTINETNVWTLMVGQEVLVRSRIDEDQVWKGYISLIDLENQVSNNNEMMYYGGGGGETSTKYPFYIELESSEGLMLGQHVFIELDMGQDQPQPEGLWLNADYIVFDEEGNAFVWYGANSGKLEKHMVTLGEFNDELWQYQILDGLTEEDYIAWPDDTCVEGASVFRFDMSSFEE